MLLTCNTRLIIWTILLLIVASESQAEQRRQSNMSSRYNNPRRVYNSNSYKDPRRTYLPTREYRSGRENYRKGSSKEQHPEWRIRRMDPRQMMRHSNRQRHGDVYRRGHQYDRKADLPPRRQTQDNYRPVNRRDRYPDKDSKRIMSKPNDNDYRWRQWNNDNFVKDSRRSTWPQKRNQPPMHGYDYHRIQRNPVRSMDSREFLIQPKNNRIRRNEDFRINRRIDRIPDLEPKLNKPPQRGYRPTTRPERTYKDDYSRRKRFPTMGNNENDLKWRGRNERIPDPRYKKDYPKYEDHHPRYPEDDTRKNSIPSDPIPTMSLEDDGKINPLFSRQQQPEGHENFDIPLQMKHPTMPMEGDPKSNRFSSADQGPPQGHTNLNTPLEKQHVHFVQDPNPGGHSNEILVFPNKNVAINDNNFSPWVHVPEWGAQEYKKNSEPIASTPYETHDDPKSAICNMDCLMEPKYIDGVYERELQKCMCRYTVNGQNRFRERKFRKNVGHDPKRVCTFLCKQVKSENFVLGRYLGREQSKCMCYEDENHKYGYRQKIDYKGINPPTLKETTKVSVWPSNKIPKLTLMISSSQCKFTY